MTSTLQSPVPQPPPRWLAATLGSVMLLCGLHLTHIEADDNTPQPLGQFITVDGTLSDESDARIRQLVSRTRALASQQGQPAVLVFDFRPGRTDFGRALSLAEYLSSEEVAFAKTVAFLPEGLSGNSLIPVLACDEIIMTGDDGARIGPISTGRVADYRIQACLDIARGRGTVPQEIVRAWLDPGIELFRVQTETGPHFVLGGDLEEFSQNHVVRQTDWLVAGGEAAAFSGLKGRDLGFIQLLEDKRPAVARALGLGRESLVERFIASGDRRAVQIHLVGQLGGEEARQAVVMFDRARNEKNNLVIFVIDSSGGDPSQTMLLAQEISREDPNRLYTVAYIQGEARYDAAVVAMACDQIIMAPDATIGGPSPTIPGDDRPSNVEAVAREVAQRKYRPAALAEALTSPNVEVFRYRRAGGLERFLTEAEAEAQPDADQWRKGDRVAGGTGDPLEIPAREAVETFRIASGTAANFDEVRRQFDLDYDPPRLQPGWADRLADTLRDDWVATFLLFLGIMALWTEMQAPTTGLGFLVGGLCLALFFWSRMLNGTLAELEMILFGAGVLCLLLEIFVLPGFGLFGIFGGLLVITSLVLASQTFVIPTDAGQIREMAGSLLVIFLAGVASVAAGMVLQRYLPHTPLFNQLMLAPPTEQELAQEQHELDEQTASMIGQKGQTLTRLAPAGKAKIGDRWVDVVAEGQFIERGAVIEVVEARGNRIVVRGVET